MKKQLKENLLPPPNTLQNNTLQNNTLQNNTLQNNNLHNQLNSPLNLYDKSLNVITTLHNYCHNFLTTKNRHLQLDLEYLNQLQNLYLNIKKSKQLKLYCYKGQFLCKSPGIVTCNYQEFEENLQIVEQLKLNRNYAKSLVENDHVNYITTTNYGSNNNYGNKDEIYSFILRMEGTAKYLWRERLDGMASQWYYLLLDFYCKNCNNDNNSDNNLLQFGPVKSALERILKFYKEKFKFE